MTERVHYSNAPIIEALIDLRVTHTHDFTVNDLGAIGEEIADIRKRRPRMPFGYYRKDWLALPNGRQV